MSEAWEFDAPTFVDFGNNGHETSVDVENYFNFDHERQFPSAVATKHDSMIEDATEHSGKDDTNNNIRLTFEKSEEVASPQVQSNTHSGVMHDSTIPVDSLDEAGTSSQDERDEVERSNPPHQEMEWNVPDIVISVAEKPTIAACVTEQMSKCVSQNCTTVPQDSADKDVAMEDAPKQAPLPNIVTPNRAAAWQNASRARALAQQRKTGESRSKQLQKVKEYRRSAPAARWQTQEPPKKKQKKKEVVKLVEPQTPKVLRHTRSQSTVKSTEDLELEKIQQLKDDAKKVMKESKRSMKRALSHDPERKPGARLEGSKFTSPKAFKFRTDERIKSTPQVKHSMETRQKSSEADFAKGLRQHPASPKKLTPTVVKPFHFSTSRKRGIDTTQEVPHTSKPYKFEPMTKAIVDFHGRTRPRTATHTESKKGPLKATRMLTTTMTPKLESKNRKRPITVISAKEIEDKEVEEMKNYHFRARPADHNILERRHRLPEAKRSFPTEPVEFHLGLEKKIQDKPKVEEQKSPIKEFKANPVPTKVLKGEKVKSVQPAPATLPQSPAFCLKNRMQIHQKNKENMELRALAEGEESERLRKKKRIPADTGVTMPVVKKKCEVKPFSFDERDKERFAKKEEKIRQIVEDGKAAASSFKAKPIRIPEEPDVPAKVVKPTTHAEPFHLASDMRGATKSAKWRQEVEGEMKKLRESAEFKANTSYVKVLHGRAFQPKKTTKVTKFKEFSLHTVDRAAQREEFEARQKDKEAKALEEEERVKKEQELEAERMAQEQRKQSVHQAAPIRKFKPVVIEGSTKVLTEPQSPEFSDRFYKKS